ncbi:MAG: TetR/AcrR family transcriptional regulator [Pseudomonadota bacterium]
MSRPREFDPELAVQGAMDVFWVQGFKATNLPDLLTAMGLTRGSFYKAFRDKETAYLAALDRYDELVVTETVTALTNCKAGSAAQCLSMLFQSSGDSRRGCFICNAMVELGPDHPQVAERTGQMAGRLRDAIRDVLVRSGDQTDEQVNGLADTILHLYFGFQAMGRSGGGDADWSLRLQRVLQ